MGFSRLFGGHDQPKAAGAKEASSTKGVGVDVPYWKKLPRRYEQLKRKAAELRRRREHQEKRAKQLALQRERAQQKAKERQQRERKPVKSQAQQQQLTPSTRMDICEQECLRKPGNEHAYMEDLMSPRSVCDSNRAMEHGQAA
ncbi:unnamed protein product [Closterium sp. NIES-64]|nr:unnamed protein product [Closterium sp. Naga37s-1]CAI5942677.1 unnamed protein product [Closterium sp. NIES-64]